MIVKKDIEAKNVSEILKALNLSQYQKCEDFHILRFRDHFKEMPHHIDVKSEGFFEVTLSLDDDTDIAVDGKPFKDYSDHLMFLSPGQRVLVDVNDDATETTSNGYMMLFNSDFLPFAKSNYSILKQFPFFSMNYSPMYALNNKQSALFLQYIERIFHEFKNLNTNSIEIIRSFLTIILYESKRSLDDNEFRNTINSRAEEITYQFEKLLKNSLKPKQKLSFYAEKLNISTIYLSECIKKVTGRSAKKILTEFIILESKYLLDASNDTIDVISDKIGFDDISNFTNFFKSNTGITPNQYRKR